MELGGYSMHGRCWRVLGFVLLGVAAAGCGASTPVGADTGAKELVRAYFEALVHRDWSTAYVSLHADSRKRWTLEQFARMAQNHRAALGFEPEEVHLGSCEEHENSATAHALLTGHVAGKTMTGKDAVVLKRGEAGWGIVLPHNFGAVRSP